MTDYDADVPLDRDEEEARQLEGLPSAKKSSDPTIELLFRTRVSSLNPRKPLTVAVGASVAEACARMREARVGCILVMDGDELVGIFTERDVLYKVTSSELAPSEIKIEEMMTPGPTVLRASHRLAEVLNKMALDGCRHIPIVTRDGKPEGVVSVRRIVDYLAEAFAGKLQTLPPDPDQEMPTVEGG